jgi:hypothetical protein
MKRRLNCNRTPAVVADPVGGRIKAKFHREPQRTTESRRENLNSDYKQESNF